MLAHDAWATRSLLTLCRKLSYEQFHQHFDIGLGTLHENITHIISATRRWTDRLAGREPRPMLHVVKEYPHLSGEAKPRTPDELLMLHDEAASDLFALAQIMRAGDQHATALARTLSLDWPGDDGKTKRYTFTRAAVLVHICTHAMHHRAQCMNMLRHLNIPGLSDKLPDLSAVDWQAETELPPVAI
jgi:uncharacterized damage-inducible protein DinB